MISHSALYSTQIAIDLAKIHYFHFNQRYTKWEKGEIHQVRLIITLINSMKSIETDWFNVPIFRLGAKFCIIPLFVLPGCTSSWGCAIKLNLHFLFNNELDFYTVWCEETDYYKTLKKVYVSISLSFHYRVRL